MAKGLVGKISDAQDEVSTWLKRLRKKVKKKL